MECENIVQLAIPTSTPDLNTQSLITLLWSQSRCVALLLDQIGLGYHRALRDESLELFTKLTSRDIVYCCRNVDPLGEEINALSLDLVRIQTSLISSMDDIVVNTLEQTSGKGIVGRLLQKRTTTNDSATSRFNQLISPILEKSLCK